MVYAGGAVIDTAGHDITIHKKLQAPPGQGITNTLLLLTGTNQGAGYKGEPLVRPELTPGGLANVTAVANLEDDGSGQGTFKIASIRITNPGVNWRMQSAMAGGRAAAGRGRRSRAPGQSPDTA